MLFEHMQYDLTYYFLTSQLEMNFYKHLCLFLFLQMGRGRSSINISMCRWRKTISQDQMGSYYDYLTMFAYSETCSISNIQPFLSFSIPDKKIPLLDRDRLSTYYFYPVLYTCIIECPFPLYILMSSLAECR